MEDLIYSFLYAIAAFFSYLFNKRYNNLMRDEAEGDFKYYLYVHIFKRWIIIIGFAVASIVYFLKAVI